MINEEVPILELVDIVELSKTFIKYHNLLLPRPLNYEANSVSFKSVNAPIYFSYKVSKLSLPYSAIKSSQSKKNGNVALFKNLCCKHMHKTKIAVIIFYLQIFFYKISNINYLTNTLIIRSKNVELYCPCNSISRK